MAVLEATRGRFEESESRRQRALRISDAEGWAGFYQWRAVWAAWAQLLSEKDEAGARRIMDEALTRYPVESVPDGEAPVLDIAFVSAALGREELSRAMLQRHQEAAAAFATGGWEVALNLLTESELALQRGDFDEAIDLLAGMERSVCQPCGLLWMGRAADMAGLPEAAIAAFEKYLGRPWSMRGTLDGFALGSVLERLGQLHDERGDTERAAVYYAQFTDLWSEADPSVQPRVEAARARLEEIVRERG
jgi:tetratricopeptide (TPR) repeat protein